MSIFDHKGAADVRNALFNGTGNVHVYNLLGARSMPPFKNVLACSLEPSGKVGVHVQQEFAEIVIGIRGSGRAIVNGRALALESFDVVHLPLGATLAIENSSATETLDYLIVKAAGS